MSYEAKIQPSATPEQQQVLEINDALRQFQFTLWGHGTPSAQPEEFFQD